MSQDRPRGGAVTAPMSTSITPLKAASRAYVNAGTESGNSEKTIYDAFHERDQKEADESMRAALMALAECELDEPMINAGWEDDHGTDDFDRDFRRLLHFICHADTEQAENQGSASLPSDQSGNDREAE